MRSPEFALPGKEEGHWLRAEWKAGLQSQCCGGQPMRPRSGFGVLRLWESGQILRALLGAVPMLAPNTGGFLVRGALPCEQRGSHDGLHPATPLSAAGKMKPKS